MKRCQPGNKVKKPSTGQVGFVIRTFRRWDDVQVQWHEDAPYAWEHPSDLVRFNGTLFWAPKVFFVYTGNKHNNEKREAKIFRPDVEGWLKYSIPGQELLHGDAEFTPEQLASAGYVNAPRVCRWILTDDQRFVAPPTSKWVLRKGRH